MRLWHTDLIEVLPREQLIAQWRECSAIAGAIQKNGTPNHVLVNFVTKFDYSHFISYTYYIRQEMKRRKYRTMDSVWEKIVALKSDWELIPKNELFPGHMVPIYRTMCYYNLMEKWFCGGISINDWMPIENLVYELDHQEELEVNYE